MNVVMEYLAFPWVSSALKILVLCLLGLSVLKMIDSFMKYLSKRTGVEGSFLKPVSRIAKALIILALVSISFSTLGISIEGVWTFVTTMITLIAIGFIAVWSVLSNFVCTLLILILKPFNVGDEVSFPGETISGRVTDLTLAYTTLKKADGSHFRIPNNLFFQKTIQCRSIQNPPKTLIEQFNADSPAEIDNL